MGEENRQTAAEYPKVEIYSFEAVERRAKTPWGGKTALISVGDIGTDAPTLNHKPDYYLRLTFDDVSDDDPDDDGVQITPEQAGTIAKFIIEHIPLVNTFTFQCEYGESRSAAIAAAMLQYFSGSGIDIFADTRYFPNKLAYKMVLASLSRLN
ncbi:hypothetical protein FACS189490_09500 [Clostridia bacterium]|nr:hypothetical protein FACS189490_09500 [Clostridia bacterium]